MSNQNGARDLKSAIRELAAALEQGLDDHPSRKELLDLAAGDLPEPKRDQIEEHLALCHRCSRILDALTVEEPALAHLTEKDLDAEWKRFQKAAGISPRPRRFVALAAAAALLIGVLGGLAVWREMMRPKTDDQVVYLRPVDEGTPRSSPREEDTIRRDGHYILVLDLLGSKSKPLDADHRIQVQTMAGREIWNLPNVRPQEDGAFTLTIPRRTLSAGNYRILLFDPQGERLAEYLLRIDSESP